MGNFLKNLGQTAVRGLTLPFGAGLIFPDVADQIGGGALEAVGISGYGPDRWYDDPADQLKSTIQPWEQQAASAFNVSPRSPLVTGWENLANTRTRSAGGNAAAGAAAGARAGTRGLVGLGRLAPQEWARLMEQAIQLRNAQDQVPTESRQDALLRGFTGGGGFQGIGSVGASGSRTGGSW